VTDYQEADYDRILNLVIIEAHPQYNDRPSSKLAYLLKNTFGINRYDMDLGVVECRARPETQGRANAWLSRHLVPDGENGAGKAIVLHYQGGSGGIRKDLADWQGEEIARTALRLGRKVVLVDMNRRSPLAQMKGVVGLHNDDPLWQGLGNGDAATMAALFGSNSVEAFVGIDSGPGKIASTTATPTLICWTKNHPLEYHDPADNTDHLVPVGWREASPIEGDPERLQWFLDHYEWIEYTGEHGLVGKAISWLVDVLGGNYEDKGVVFVVPGDLRGAAWAATKLRGIAAGRPVEVIVSGNPRFPERSPGAALLRQLEVADKVRIAEVPIHYGPERPTNTRGHYLYVAEGLRDGKHFLLPNIVFQAGRDLSEWMPDVPVDEKIAQKVKELL
jgi:hypothetical protein